MNINDIFHHLHTIAELSYQEKNTQQFIENYFKNHKCKIYKYKTSIIIYFDLNKSETIGFRCEEDALPIQEVNDNQYKNNEGHMHACGHDGHMSMMIKLGDYINDNLASMKYNVILIFQMAEECAFGAIDLINNSILNSLKIKYIFAFHLFPGLKEGYLFAKKGQMLAKCMELDVIFKGKSSHVANKNQGIDANEAGYLFIKNIKKLAIMHKKNVTYLFGTINGGCLRNIVSSSCIIKGTLRVFDENIGAKIIKKIKLILNKIQRKTKCICSLKINDNYKVVFNSNALYEKAKKIIPIYNTDKKLIGDDFCHYQDLCPCLYILLGIDSSPLHSETFLFNEHVLNIGLDNLKKLLFI